jgi:hypothetical protein
MCPPVIDGDFRRGVQRKTISAASWPLGLYCTIGVLRGCLKFFTIKQILNIISIFFKIKKFKI